MLLTSTMVRYLTTMHKWIAYTIKVACTSGRKLVNYF